MTDCLFCRIIEKKIPAKLEYEDEQVLAFQDINPQAPIHLLLIPRQHIAMIGDLQPSEASIAGALIFRAKEIAASRGWKDYRLLFNNGPEAGQTVYHIHLHLLSGRRFAWPPG